MRIFDPLRKNPVAALCVVVAGVVGWAVAGLLSTDPRPVAHDGHGMGPPVKGFRLTADGDSPAEHQTIPLELLPRLKPGMTRVEIDTLLGPPTASSLRPITTTGGRTTYQAAYELGEPDQPQTVRPIRVPRPPREPGAAKSIVALEFDASRPGHPLVGVLFLDPLF